MFWSLGPLISSPLFSTFSHVHPNVCHLCKTYFAFTPSGSFLHSSSPSSRKKKKQLSSWFSCILFFLLCVRTCIVCKPLVCLCFEHMQAQLYRRVLNIESTNYRPQTMSNLHLFCQIKFYWNMVTLTHLHTT